MNRIYRLVFNRALGVMQVASELAQSTGGATADGSGRTTATLRPVSFALWLALGWVGLAMPGSAQQAQGRIAADANAPGNQRPTVLQAPNGVPLVNIQTPSAAGVSRNVYSQFDVNAEGAILNNSRTNTQTQLGGWVQGNPWLASGTAKVILNEVNSSNPSHLNGYIEVAGSRAEVVIANPAGISVDGGGFINASRATLTTGKPIVNGGSLDGYRVEGGTIRIDGAGLDATRADYTDLIARSLQLNGGLWANQLQATLGTNVVSADHTQITATTPSDTAPTFALDSSALGGMYANKITLLGTEHGVGVRNAGAIGAQAGNLVVTIDGRLVNTGQMQAQNSAALDLNGGIANVGTISAGQELRIATPQDLDNSGGTLNARRLDVTASRLANRGGSIEQTGLQALQLDVGALSNRDGGHIGLAELTSGGSGGGGTTGGSPGGTGGSTPTDPNAPTVPAPPVVPLADGVLRIAGTLDNDAGAILASGGVGLRSDNGLDNDGGRLGLASLTVSQGDIRNAGGTLAVQGAAQLHADTINNDAGQLSVGGPLSLSAQSFSNRDGEFLHGGSNATSWQIAGMLDNTSGRLATNATAFELAAGTLVNEQGKIEHAGTGGMTLDTDQFLGSGGSLTSASALQWTAGAVDHRNATLSAAGINVDTQSFDNAGGAIASGSNANYVIAGALGNSGGTLGSAGDMQIVAQTFANVGGSVQSAGTGMLDIQATTLDGATGTIAGNGALTITGQTTDLSGGTTSAQSVAIDTETLRTASGMLSSAGTLNLTARQLLDNAAGNIASVDALTVQGGAVVNTDGSLATGGALNLTASGLTNTRGRLESGATAQVQVTGPVANHSGRILAQDALRLDSASLDNTNGLVGAIDGALDLSVTGAVTNVGGQLQSGTDLTVRSNGLDNSGGSVQSHTVTVDAGTGTLDNDAGRIAGQNVQIGSGTLSNDAGLLQASATLGIDTHGQSLINVRSGTANGISSGGGLTIASGDLNNSTGVIIGAGPILVQSAAIDNASGQIGSHGALSLTGTRLDNHAGQIQAQGDADVNVGAGTLDNTTGLLASVANLIVDAANLINRDTQGANQGVLGANTTVDAATIDNTHGLLTAQQTLTITGSGVLNNIAGELSAGTTLDLRDAGATRAIDNAGGRIVAGDQLTLQAQSLTGNGAVQSGRNANIDLVDRFDNTGRVQANGDLTLDTQGDLTNSGKINAGRALSVHAHAIDNAATGEITATNGGVHLITDTMLTNRGLIDSVATRIDAMRIDNLGAGRIYGDHVSLGAGTVNNLEETVGGVTRSGTIAARERLDIGAGTLNNRREALIYSGGDAAIGGSLDADGLATGTATEVNNTSAVIDVAGALAIDAVAVNNVRENVVVTPQGTQSIDQTTTMQLAGWQQNGPNSSSTLNYTNNYRAFQVLYVSPADILEDGAYITPDGNRIGRAVIRLTPSTSSYFFAYGGAYGARGERWRLNEADGTITVYYTLRQDGQTNPDQGGSDDPFVELSAGSAAQGHPLQYQTDNLTYSNAYGTCTNDCVQLVTPWQYADPDGTIFMRINDPNNASRNEQQRIAHHTAFDDTIAPGIGADAVIRSGGDMRLQVDGLTNRYGRIAAGGELAIVGHNGTPVVSNIGQTLYRTHTFNNTSVAYDGTHTNWTNPSLSEQIGQIGGTIVSNGTLVVDTGDLSNLDVGRNAPGVVDPSVLVNLNAGTVRNAGDSTSVSVSSGAAVTEVVANATTGPATIRTQPANFALPSSSLFQLTANGGNYLVETDPRFADYRNWLGSDYLLGLLGVDPTRMHKRLGDGYYEQRLVRDQIAQLTGRRFLDGYASDEEQFRALMNAGALFAQAYGLRPGIALTAAQMAQLTSDIVWLVEQEVTLPDGTRTTVMVPQVYVRLQPGDLHANGALLAGADVRMNLRGNLVNTGDIAGRQIVSINANNIDNLAGGAISGQRVGLQAVHDIHVIGATVTAADALSAKAGGNVTVASTTATQSGSGPYSWSQTTVDRVAGLYVTNPGGLGVLSVSAGGDVTLQAAQIRNAGTEGMTRIAAGGDLNLGTVTTAQRQNHDYDARNFRHSASSTEVGTTIEGANGVQLIAGQDINARAAQIDAGGAVQMVAGRDISIVEGRATTSIDNSTHSQSSGFLSKKSYTEQAKQSTDTSIASNINAGGTVDIAAGRDYLQRGSNVLGDGNVGITAGHNATIESAQDTYHQDVQVAQKKSGFTAGYSGGVASVGYGSAGSKSQSTIGATTQVASGVGSTAGNVTIKAGDQLTIAGSDVAADHNLSLIGQDVKLEARQDTYEEHTTSSSKQSGFSVGVTLDPAAAYRSARDATTAGMPDSGSSLSQLSRTAEGHASGARAATTAVVVRAGSSQSSDQSDTASSTARTTQLSAGNNLTILATDGSISSQGAQMSAEGNALLLAKDDIVLDVAHNTQSTDSTSRASGWSVANNTTGLPVGVYHQKGNGNGSTDTITGTQISAGGGVAMATQEGDITLTATQIAAENDVNINAARNLTIQSGQDTAGNENHRNDKAIGSVVISDTERFAGYHNEKSNNTNASVTQVASNIGSLTGNVNLTAGETYTQTASNVVAANDVNVTAKRIELLTADNVNTEHQDSQDTKIGVFARVNSPLIDLVNDIDAARKSDGRLQTMQGMSAAASAYQTASAISNAAKGGDAVLLKAEAGIGFSQGKSRYDASSAEAVGSNISGGGNVTLTSTQGDIHGVQANLKAGDTLTLDSANDIVLEAGKSQYGSDGKSSNMGAEVGVGVSVGAQTGVYVYAQASAGSSKSNSDATYYENTHLAADTINVKSKGDTTLQGADARANTINADVGGALTIESVQDTATEMAKNSGFNARAQVSFGTAWEASANASSAKASGSYTAVDQQSGLFAGEGGYHVNADRVNLKGGAITSTNAANSELTANSLTFENLQNQMDHQASSASLGGGTGGTHTGDSVRGGYGTPGGVSYSGGVPMSEKGHDSSTTYATLTEGNITIGGQKTTAAATGIHTDATTAHTTIKDLPELQKVLADQQAMSAAAGNVVSTSQQIAGDIAANAQAKADAIRDGVYDTLSDAEKQRFQSMSPAEREVLLTSKSADYAQAIGTAKDWGTGGNYSRALGAMTTALVGGVSGQGATQTLTNALAPYAAQIIGNQFDSNHGSDPNAAAQLLSHAILGGLLAEVNGGSAVGGALAGAGGELAAQVLTKQLYGSTNPKDLTEQQKQTVSALSQALGALAGGIAGGGNGGLYSAAVSSNVAKNAVENNRMLTLQEQDVIAQLVKAGYSEEKVQAVACALVQCLLGRGLMEPGTMAEGLAGHFYLTQAGEQLAGEYQSVFSQMSQEEIAAIANRLTGTGLFQYSAGDAWNDAKRDTNFMARLDGLGQATSGALGALGISAFCTLTAGWGCAAGGTAAAAEASDNITAGLATFYGGRPTLTLQNQVWQGLGLSPEHANYAEAFTGLAISAGGAYSTNRALSGSATTLDTVTVNGIKSERIVTGAAVPSASGAGRLWVLKEVDGRRVYQNDALFDALRTDAKGRTNIERMSQGLSPIGPDGKAVELHHLLQQEMSGGVPAPLAEISSSLHSTKYDVLHLYPRNSLDYTSWRKLYPDQAAQYDAFRRNYWMQRSEGVSP